MKLDNSCELYDKLLYLNKVLNGISKEVTLKQAEFETVEDNISTLLKNQSKLRKKVIRRMM